MSRTFKKFDGENEQREQYFRSEREESKRKKFQRQQVVDDEDVGYEPYPDAQALVGRRYLGSIQ